MDGLKLISTGGAVPKKSVHNDDLAKIMDTNDEWIFSRTGIHSRYFCEEGESTLTLAIEAARQAIERAGIGVDEIGCLILGTCSGDYASPSTACLVQAELGLPEDIPVTDVNSACTGFLYATEIARGFLQESDREYALVISSEEISRYLNMNDRSTAVLFGDGAGAAIYKRDPDAEYACLLGAKGGLEINVPGAGTGRPADVSMDGKAVFRFATSAITKCLNAILDRTGKTLDDVDWVLCHQANARIIDHCIKKMKAPKEKFFEDMDHFGNTSGASIPLALNEMVEQGLLKKGQNVLMVGFGSGLTWGGNFLVYEGV